jgi:hypothetical protein
VSLGVNVYFNVVEGLSNARSVISDANEQANKTFDFQENE